jgi:hypothetical protein
MNALIIYATVDFADKAKAMVEGAASWADETTHCGVKLWRVDSLDQPPAIGASLAEAAEANLIILAASQVKSLLPWLMGWLEHRVARRHIQEAALAIWDHGILDTPLKRVPPEFSQCTKRHGLSLLSDENALAGGSCSSFAKDLHNREVSLTSTLKHILEQPLRGGNQCWRHSGINE